MKPGDDCVDDVRAHDPESSPVSDPLATDPLATDPVGVLGDPDRAAGSFIFTVEHGGNALFGVPATATDRALLDDHWGWDPGAAAVTAGLVEALDGVAVVARFTRLLVDPNRALDSPSLIVPDCEGVPVSFNRGLTAEDRAARVRDLYGRYHDTLHHVTRRRLARGPARLVSMHSFTPVWRGVARPMELGVLFDRYAAHAAAVADALSRQGFVVALNAPYSGLDGMIHSVRRHGTAADVPYLEMEIRQDLVRDAAGVARVTAALREGLRAFAP